MQQSCNLWVSLTKHRSCPSPVAVFQQHRIVAILCVMNILRARDKQESATKSKSNAVFAPLSLSLSAAISLAFHAFPQRFPPWPLSRVSSFVACSLFATFILISCHDNDNDAGGKAPAPTQAASHHILPPSIKLSVYLSLSDQQQQQQQHFTGCWFFVSTF